MFHLRFVLLLVLIMSMASLAADTNFWPCFHGPQRNNQSKEKGLLQSWPQGGPELLWTATNIGHGFSSVAIADGRIFTAGMIDKQTYVTSLDMNGKQLWQKLNGQSWQASKQQPWAVPHAGSRGTPTVDGDIVYHLSEMGQLTAFDVGNGKEKWSTNVLKTFKAERPKYGLSESLLIYGNTIICCPGGAEGYIVTLDKNTGGTLWTNNKMNDPVGYSSPIVARIDGIEQVITLSAERIFSFEPENGRILWEYPFGNERNNSATDVIVKDGLVYASTGYGGGSILLRPRRQADGKFSVERVWKSDLLDNHHGGVILLNGCLYGSGHNARGWFCLDFKTGSKMWQVPGKGSLTFADGRLYCLDERGKMSLVKASAESWDEISSFEPPKGGRGYFWAHPVICGGRLYVRHSDKLFAYDVRGN